MYKVRLEFSFSVTSKVCSASQEIDMTLYPLKLKNSQKHFDEREAAPGNVKLIKHAVWRNQNITGDFDIWVSLSRELLESPKQTFSGWRGLLFLTMLESPKVVKRKINFNPTKRFDFLENNWRPFSVINSRYTACHWKHFINDKNQIELLRLDWAGGQQDTT